MSKISHDVIRFGLETLYFSGAYRLLQPLAGGIGAILMLHHVRPGRPDLFQPNRLLEVTPDFLEQVILELKAMDIDIVSLDEMHHRVSQGKSDRRFVAFTLDDGYRDVKEHGYPIFKKYNVPFAMYVATSFPERLGELWWLALEAVVARNDHVTLTMDGTQRTFACASVDGKRAAFAETYWWLRQRATEDDLREAIRDLAARYEVDILAFCAELCMDWDELADMARDPLVTIGAHTVNHFILKKVPDDVVRAEMRMSSAAIEARLGQRPEHFAYPVGDATAAGPREFRIASELGFKTAVTTRPGVIFPEHRDHLLALPRVSLNGEFQKLRYFRVLMAGAATGLANRFRRVNTA